MIVSVTHIAGLVIEIGPRVIQRCGVCGEKLVDNKDVAMPVREDGSVDKIATWCVGGLVRREGHRWHAIAHVNGEDLPADNCLDLVED